MKIWTKINKNEKNFGECKKTFCARKQKPRLAQSARRLDANLAAQILSITSLLLGSLILVLLSLVFAVKFFADFSLQNLEKRADFSVFLRENTDWFALQSLQNELEKLPVQSEILQAQSIENFQIPSRLHVKFLDLRAVSPALEILKKPRYDQVVGDWDAVGEREFALLVQRLLAIGNGLEIAGFWLVGLFWLGGGLLAINTFRIVLFARKKEILIGPVCRRRRQIYFWPVFSRRLFARTVFRVWSRFWFLPFCSAKYH